MSRNYFSFNPFTQKLLKEFRFSSETEISDALERSHLAFKDFSKLGFDKRAEKLNKLADGLKLYKDELAKAMSMEMGKPLTQSIGEILKSAECCSYYAKHAENLLKDTRLPLANECYVRFEPIGSLFLIMPFNFPTWMPLKTSIPHLMAGNTIILKHAENVQITAELLDKITSEAGLVDEFINIRPGIESIEKIIRNPRVMGVSLTGSVNAGKAIGMMAAANLKKFVLELGGSDPYIVLPDADLPKAAKMLVAGRLAGCGQVCISPKRAIICSAVYDEFVRLVHEEIQKWSIVDPLDEKTTFGPMARSDLVTQAYNQVKASVALGAKLLHGGKPINEYWFPPTLLADVTESMPVFIEEVFAPVIVISKARNEADAIRMANNTEFGLSASIFTKDVQRANREIAPAIQSGMVFINDVSKSIVQVPFGGFKNSGLGRELGEVGIREFCNPKTVFLG